MALFPLPAYQAAAFELASTTHAARLAARAWLEAAPDVPPAHYRDQQFRAHCKDRAEPALGRRIRRAAFKQAFAQELGHIFVDEARLHAPSS
ncbi:Uncharacterised protein [Achromobacter kerstersii]|nr:Uncharacterised protein [Achromobacter kerstersii]